MSKVKVLGFTISTDGYGAGPDQGLSNPLGVGGTSLHGWLRGTQTFNKMFGGSGGTTGVDDTWAARAMENIGAWIMGRNMFGPIRGPWPDDKWKGWWGENPPYHVPVYVLTNHARPPITMQGGTMFHFVTDGIRSALNQAIASSQGKDVRLGGGVSTIRQYLEAGLVDEMHLALSPVLLGRGEHLLANINLLKLGFRVAEHVPSERAMHVLLRKG